MVDYSLHRRQRPLPPAAPTGSRGRTLKSSATAPAEAYRKLRARSAWSGELRPQAARVRRIEGLALSWGPGVPALAEQLEAQGLGIRDGEVLSRLERWAESINLLLAEGLVKARNTAVGERAIAMACLHEAEPIWRLQRDGVGRRGLGGPVLGDRIAAVFQEDFAEAVADDDDAGGDDTDGEDAGDEG